jgi:hypothetical protein
VIPADRKWFARMSAAAVLVHTLIELDPRFPTVTKQRREELQRVRQELETQAPKGVASDPFERARSDGKSGRPRRARRPDERSATAGAAKDGARGARRPRM